MLKIEDFLIFFSNSLDLEKDEVNSDSKLESLWQWDSVGKLSFLSDLNSKFNITINSDQLNNFQTVYDIFVYIKANS